MSYYDIKIKEERYAKYWYAKEIADGILHEYEHSPSEIVDILTLSRWDRRFALYGGYSFPGKYSTYLTQLLKKEAFR